MDTVDGGAGSPPGGAGLFLLFPSDDRPSADDILRLLGGASDLQVSLDPRQNPDRLHPGRTAPEGEGHWLELWRDGLTFDLLGLAPGPSLRVPTIAHRFGSDLSAEDSAEAIALFPGPHIAEAAGSLPVVRTMMATALRLLDDFPQVSTLVWRPARSAVSVPFFRRTVEDWLSGGAFPALGLVGIAFGAGGELRTEGLAFFAARELVVEQDLANGRPELARLAARIVHELVASGGEIDGGRCILSTEAGLEIELSSDGDDLFRVRPAGEG